MTDRSVPRMLSCPTCAQDLPAGRPENGYGFALCAHCTRLAVVQSGPYGLMVRKPTASETDRALAREDVRKLIAALTERER